MTEKVYCENCRYLYNHHEDRDEHCLKFVKKEYDNWYAHHRIYGLCKNKNSHNDCSDYEVIQP